MITDHIHMRSPHLFALPTTVIGFVLFASPLSAKGNELAVPPLEHIQPLQVQTTVEEGLLPDAPEINLKLGMITSIFRLDNKASGGAVNNTLYSKPNLGAEVYLGFDPSDKVKVWLGASLEHIEMKPSEGAEISSISQNFLGLHLITQIKLTPFSFLKLGVRSIERPFSRPTLSGTNIDKAFVPELSAAYEWHWAETSTGQIWLSFEGIYSLSADTGQQKVKSGYGAMTGPRLDFQLEKSVVSLMPAYRLLKQDTDTAKNNQEAFVLNISGTW